MGVLGYNLQKFLNSSRGPVTSIVSTPFRGWPGGTLWHSIALLHPDFLFVNKLIKFRHRGAGWSMDREESRRIALVEAVEGWAWNAYLAHCPEKAGMDINDTANGFAAMPACMGAGLAAINGYCEVVEHWLMNSIWDDGDAYFEECGLKNAAISRLLNQVSDEHCFFGLKVSPEPILRTMPRSLDFRICLIKTRPGGLASGQACSQHARNAFNRAVMGAYVHASTFDRYLNGFSREENMIEEKRIHFGELAEGYKIIKGLIKRGDPGAHKPPPVVFSKQLPGPWEPEIAVHRVILAGVSRHFSARLGRSYEDR